MEQITAKDLLLTTKDKLAELELKLRKLRELTSFQFPDYIKTARKMKDVQYHINVKENKEKPEIYCYVVRDISKLGKKINGLRERYGFVDDGECGPILRNNNGEVFFDIKRYEPIVLSDDQEDFGKIADEIVNDDFIMKFLSNSDYYSTAKDTLKFVFLTTRSIGLHGANDTLLDLSPLDNTAYFRNTAIENKILNEYMMYSLLNAPLDLDRLTEEQIEYIEKSPARNKDIYISHFFDISGKPKFRVSENEKSLKLLKRL